MDQDQYESMQMHINNCMTIFPPEFDVHVRFMYLFLLHHAIVDNQFEWEDSYFKSVLRFSDHRMEKCKKLLTMFGFMDRKIVYSKKEKKTKAVYEMHFLKNLE